MSRQDAVGTSTLDTFGELTFMEKFLQGDIAYTKELFEFYQQRVASSDMCSVTTRYVEQLPNYNSSLRT